MYSAYLVVLWWISRRLESVLVANTETQHLTDTADDDVSCARDPSTMLSLLRSLLVLTSLLNM